LDLKNSTKFVKVLVGFMNFDIPSINFLDNSLTDYLWASIIFIGLNFLFWLLHKLFAAKLKRLVKNTTTDADDMVFQVFQTIKPPFYLFVSFYFATRYLEFSGTVQQALDVFLIAWAVYQGVLALQIIIDYTANHLKQKEKSATSKEAVETLAQIIKAILWAIGVLFLLQNLGINVTSLVAGLGIGGIAVALAAQNVLGDLFSSFAILFDKPFEPGDFIIVGDSMGIVEDIGIKTTRIRALQGEEIVISNQELTSSRIQNFKKMKERRIDFDLGILYETKPQKLSKIPGIIKEVINQTPKTRFERAHFYEFGDSALKYKIIYFVLSSDYNEYMDVHQDILFNIHARFEKEKIGFAYPTQTIYMSKK